MGGHALVLPAVLALSAALASPQDPARNSRLLGSDPARTRQYLSMVERYAAGDRAEALAALEDWTQNELQFEVEKLRDLGVAARGLPLRAVAMLHTDKAGLELGTVPPDEGEARCRSNFHLELAAEIVPLLTSWEEGRAFARRWYLATALESHGRFCFIDARRWAQGGLKWFPKDAELLLASGTTDEALGSLPGWSHVRLDAFPTQRRLRESMGLLSDRRSYLDRARRAFERALATDGNLGEAWLRLGRVEWGLAHGDAARRALLEGLGRAREPSVLYLGHLFLGQVHEDAGRLEEAAREYRAALAVDPLAQAAAVALSWVLQVAGDVTGSRDVLDQAVASVGRRPHADAHWDYLFGRSADAGPIFEELRSETLQ